MTFLLGFLIITTHSLLLISFPLFSFIYSFSFNVRFHLRLFSSITIQISISIPFSFLLLFVPPYHLLRFFLFPFPFLPYIYIYIFNLYAYLCLLIFVQWLWVESQGSKRPVSLANWKVLEWICCRSLAVLLFCFLRSLFHEMKMKLIWNFLLWVFE